MTSILTTIAKRKHEEVAFNKKHTPLSALADKTPLPNRDFVTALTQHRPAIIAEIKKASPSKGILRADFDVATLASIYNDNGAAALSVLTDIDFFQGHPSYLATAKAHSALPVLRKDFIIDEYQIHESKALGADCILLIVALLDEYQLHDYCQLALSLNLAVLVESHTEQELTKALALPTPLMGINNRSLHSFEISLDTTLRLKSLIPSDKIIITESGIHTRDDIELMQQHNIHTFLIGESLMKHPNIALQLKQLMNL